MKALITGASSGIGRDMAKILGYRGFELILVARRTERLEELAKTLPTKVRIIPLDLSSKKNCYALYESTKEENIDILINNAGFGLYGEFIENNLERELEMIQVNIRAVHMLTKLFLRDFVKKDSGYILNVASSAAFLPGPLMATYYATKSYVLRLTEGIHEELRRKKSHVYIGALCPGPVSTEFGSTANVHFNLKGMSSHTVAHYALRQMFLRKMVIIPGGLMKAAYVAEKFFGEEMLTRIAYQIQQKKDGLVH